MRVFLVILLLVYTTGATQPPSIHVEDHQVQEHSTIGRFVELREHQTIIFKCGGPHDDLEFKYPNMKDHRGYNESNFENRVEEVNDDNFRDRVLTITDVQQSDTGEYSCVSLEHPSLNDTIYVFVHGFETFLRLTPVYFVYNEGEVMVPCRTTMFVDNNDIELYANNALVKSAYKNYDQRFGYKIDKKIYDVKPIENTKFECRYKKEPKQTVNYLISELEASEDSENDFELFWDKGFEWPHVGYNYSIVCRLNYRGTDKVNLFAHKIQINCPRCGNGHMIVSNNHKDMTTLRGLYATLYIDHLELEDSGDYKCVWLVENQEKEETTHHLQVAPQKAQIKVIERSPQYSRTHENNEISLYARFAIYPSDGDSYTATWSRRYNSSIKADTQSETIINDEYHTISTQLLENGVILETLVINEAVTANMSGTYELSISHLGIPHGVQWEVAIENDRPDVQITVREPSSFIVFNQQFYPPDTHLHVDCISVSIPPADVVFEKKNSESSEFEEIDENLLVRVEGTFEKGYIWNMTLECDTELRCSSSKHGKKSSITKRIIVADEALHIISEIKKSSKATSSEDSKVIYEGDHVQLSCVVPVGADDWDVTWRFADSKSPETSSLPTHTKEKELSKHVILDIYDITAGDGGKYVCVVKKDESEELLETVVDVESISKPYHIKADSRHVVTVDFDQTFVIDCHMAGSPPPEFLWYKDGNLYSVGEKNGSVLKVTRARAEDNGKFHCLATNRAGSTNHFIEVQVEGAPSGSSIAYWLTAIVTSIFVIVVIVLFLKLRNSKKIAKQKDIALAELYNTLTRENPGPLPEELKELPIEERTYYLPYRTEYEIDPANLKLTDKLGGGNFGDVYKGYLQMADPKSQIEYKTCLPVAVKMPNNPFDIEQQKMLADELKVMGAIPKHPNVLALIGGITVNMRQGKLLVVTEYIDGGDVAALLKKCKNFFVNELVDDDSTAQVDDSYMVPNSAKKKYNFGATETDRLLDANSDTLSTSDLLSIALQIANGMEWLTTIPCVHRDLACRNVLITKSKIVRVADFGLAKKYSEKQYYRVKHDKNVKLPVRSMAPESLETFRFTQKSDVWSFGICLYELFSLGGTPYPKMSNADIWEAITSGKINSQPEYCHDDVYELMKLCWQQSPEDRPTFTECIQYLKAHMTSCAKDLLTRVDNMLHMEKEEQMKLSEWTEKSRPDIPGASKIKKTPKKEQPEQRYHIVESHA